MAELKLWTVDEANAALPEVEALTARLRNAVHAHKDALGRVAELQARHGPEAVRDPSSPGNAEYREALKIGEATHARIQDVMREFADLGVEVKDPETGLVDFPAMRGSEVVYLCWKEGESEVLHWHGLTAGYRGRKPLDALALAGGR